MAGEQQFFYTITTVNTSQLCLFSRLYLNFHHNRDINLALTLTQSEDPKQTYFLTELGQNIPASHFQEIKPTSWGISGPWTHS